MKKDRNEKRRLQLNKRSSRIKATNVQNNHFSRPSRSNLFLKANGAESVHTPFNKRILSIVMAIVMVVSLIPAGIFLLKPKAEKVDYSMGPVTMNIRVNGEDIEETASVQAGQIGQNSINLGNLELPEGAIYVKSLLVDRYTGAETPIYAVGSKGSTNYYSINQDGFTGVEQTSEDILVLVFANKYDVEFTNAIVNNSNVWTVSDYGTFTTNAIKDGNNYFIYGGENLQIKEITPFEDRAVSRVTYSTLAGQDVQSSGSETIRNNAATIPANMYSGDRIRVSVNFNTIDSYSVQDARYKSGSKYYASYYNLDNHGGTTASLNTKGQNNSLPNISSNESSTTFYVYSQKNSTQSEVWRLSMLSINGVDLQFPNGVGDENAVTTEIKPGKNVTVTFVEENHRFNDDNGNRTLYKVEVPNLHEDIEVNYYFTNIRDRFIIIRDLQGIKQTGYAQEHSLGAISLLAGKYYTYTSNKQNVYNTYYDTGWLPANNLVLYTVKEGYNPYAVTTEMYYDNQKVTDASAIREGEADQVLNVILNAGNTSSGRYNTAWRFWGEADNDDLYNNDENMRLGNELLLNTLAKDKDNTWYAIALSQNSANNQQLYLNVRPYPYALKLDPNGGTYDGSTAIWSGSSTYTVESRNTLFIPSEKPVKEGYIFKGWRLEDANGEVLSGDDYLYQPSDLVAIDNIAIQNAQGTRTDSTNNAIQYITFNAQWDASQTAYTTNIQVNAYKQEDIDTENDNAPIYSNNLIQENTEVQIANIEAALLNDKTGLMNDAHYEVAAESTQPYELSRNETNVFDIYYVYRTEELTIKNTVFGYPKTQLFPVTIVFTPDSSDPVVPLSQAAILLDDGVATITPDTTNNQVVYTRNMAADNEVTLTVPYGWTYSISVESNPEDYSTVYDPDSTGVMTKDREVEITNIDANSGIETDKYISGPDEDGNYSLTMETWATQPSYTKPKKDSSATPLDIALVIDQSSSMATGDMGEDYEPVSGKTTWSISDIESYGETLFYRVGSGSNAIYYPVSLGAGMLFEATTPIEANKMFGGGHDDIIFGNLSSGIGSLPHFNVPTDYYYPDSNNVMHKVFFITVGSYLHYCAYPYYYTTLNDPYENYAEWYPTDSRGNKYYSTWISTEDFVEGYNDTNTAWMIGNNQGGQRLIYNIPPQSAPWGTIVNENRIRVIPKSGNPGGAPFIPSNLGYRATPVVLGSNYGAHYSYAWLSNAEKVAGMYQIKEGNTNNYLFYVDSSNQTVSLNNTPASNGALIPDAITTTSDGNPDYVVYTDNQTAYTGTLYRATGVTRLAALKDAVNDFTTLIANNAKEYNIDHRIAMIGFAGNDVPVNYSSGSYNYSGYNSKWDYVNTGLFLENAASLDGQSSGFKNYKTIDSFSSTNDRYINQHYYRNNTSFPQSNNKEPLLYDGRNWVPVASGGTYSTSNTFYRPNTTDLQTSDYQHAWVSVSDKDGNDFNGTVNSFVTSSINKFGAYGGTYTSYGMAMANQTLAQSNRDSRKVVIVFTDGEPGANGYEESIAGEALADSAIAKQNGYEVYTVGLYKTNPGSTIDNFMSQLSSQYNGAQTNYYAAEGLPSTNNNHGLGTGQNSLDNNQTYYYTKNGKTYAVNAIRRGSSSLGWWVHGANGSFTLVTPISTDSGAGSQAFYENGSQINGVDADPNKVYYTAASGGNPIYYEYRWYDSDNNIVIPKSSENSEGEQFFQNTMSSSSSALTYYYKASSAEELREAFQSISDAVYSNTIVMTLGGENTLVRDTISEHFQKSNNTDVKIYTADAEFVSQGGQQRLTWVNKTDVTDDIDRWEWVDVDDFDALEVQGFDFSDHYVSETRNEGIGQKLIIEISGLKPLTTGFEIESNISESSGVYELLHIDDDFNKPLSGEETLLKDFPRPEVNRPEYFLVVDGDDQDARYTVKLRLEDNEGDPITEDQWVKYSATSPELQELTFSNGALTVWENVSGSKTDSAILENVFKSLPSGYKVFATVTKSNDEPNNYDYSVTLNHETPEKSFGVEFEITPNESEIEITSTRKTKNVVIRKVTVATDPTNDFTDSGKRFDIDIQLLDPTRDEIRDTVTYGNTVYSNGVVTVSLSNAQSRVITVPVDYYVEVKEADKSEYEDDYYVSYEAFDPDDDDLQLGTFVDGSEAELQVVATNDNMRITVRNSLDTTPLTGLLDNLKINPLIIVAVVLLMTGAAWLVIYEKRKRQMNED